ncbi:hypothetical protein [Haloarchaeobius sp. DFWS5]|uniref:hypothetical protein n=1 Tax=Haloarchaeobius sp. DFWS5 TaxID=3446114 RepID=UPI003EC0A51A
MTNTPPTPPAELPEDTVAMLDEHQSTTLFQIASYAEELAEYREREEEAQDENERVDEQIENLPDGVPSKATTTIKEINDNRYYYWQWREGESIKSKYKGPVDENQ